MNLVGFYYSDGAQDSYQGFHSRGPKSLLKADFRMSQKLHDKNVSDLLSTCWSGRSGQHSETEISVDLRWSAVTSPKESRVVTSETAQKKVEAVG